MRVGSPTGTLRATARVLRCAPDASNCCSPRRRRFRTRKPRADAHHGSLRRFRARCAGSTGSPLSLQRQSAGLFLDALVRQKVAAKAIGMIHLTESIIDGALSRIETGLKRYCWIQENVHACNVSRDYVFQNRFNAFYKVRRGSDWRRNFYTLLEASKASGITFDHALHLLLEQTSRFEASFASKLVATLHPEKPVIDQHVLRNFGLRLPLGRNRENRCPRLLREVVRELCRPNEECRGCDGS